MEIIYVDSLFFINFIVNYFILAASSRICSIPLRRIRLVVSAGLGALYSVLVILPGLAFLASPLIKIAAGGFMLLTAFANERRLGRVTVVFLAVSAAFGGAVYAVSMLGGYPSPRYGPAYVSARTLILSFAVCYAALTVVFRYSGDRVVRSIKKLELTLDGNSADISALRDTGNSLREPISGRAVIIAELDVLLPLFSAESAAVLRDYSERPADCIENLAKLSYNTGRFQLVPFTAVGVSSGLLLAFKPDRLLVDGKENSEHIIAISPTRICETGEYSAII